MEKLKGYDNNNVHLPAKITFELDNGLVDEICYDIHWDMQQKAIYIEMLRSLSLMNRPGEIV